MSGAGALLASDGPYGGGGGTALNASVTWSGSNPYNVSGASGVPDDVFSYDAVGGVPPYTFSSSIASNPSGKLGVFTVSDEHANGSFQIFWNGFTLNETESATFNITVQDSVGTTVTRGRFLSIKRTS